MAPKVVEIDRELNEAAATAISAGFLENEIWVWMVPSERLRGRLLPRYYRAMIARVFAPRGGAWTTVGCDAGALWYPPGTQALSAREQRAELLSLFPWGATGLRRGYRFERLIAKHRPREAHWYLNTLSVRPGAQGRGLGGALLAAGLERADSDRLGTYLETQRPSNLPFYRHFGFEVVAELEPPGCPLMWAMWRPPVAGRRPAAGLPKGP